MVTSESGMSNIAEEDLEPHEVFLSVGLLVLEQRVPGLGDRGYGEGPHCPQLPFTYQNPRHVCDPTNSLCKRCDNWQKYMMLLWRNNVPMSIEVLLCPSCTHGSRKAKTCDASVVPDPSFLLLEQWTVQMISKTRVPDVQMTARSLLQAIRSYLHFSQLSAWWSEYGGRDPRNVMFRLTVPGEAFCNKFHQPPAAHFFPLATIGKNEALKVCVKSLPRSKEVPIVDCHLHPKKEGESTEKAGAVRKKHATCRVENIDKHDFRRQIINSKIITRYNKKAVDEGALLGDSLIDPPQSLQKYPKRYQSPSRSGSPSHEMPEYFILRHREPEKEMSGWGQDRGRPPDKKHPKWKWTEGKFPISRCGLRGPLCCDQHGKHLCDVENNLRDIQVDEYPPLKDNIVKKHGKLDYSCDKFKLPNKYLDFDLNPEEIQQVLDVLRYEGPRPTRNPYFNEIDARKRISDVRKTGNRATCSKIKNVSSMGAPPPSEEVHAHLSRQDCCKDLTKSELITASGAAFGDSPSPNDVTQKCEQLLHNLKIASHGSEPRLQKDAPRATPVSKSLSQAHCDINTLQTASEHEGVPSRAVPSASAKAQFRRSLDSAASLVFHNKTGLPLTSSPAPIRKGKAFDFDSSLTSVHAIRTALFDAEESDENDNIIKLDDSSVLSVSAPASVTSSSLLGNFEESVLNGRLEPVSTVQGFTAEIGASGSFCPRHVTVPVTVFFYSLADSDKVTTPYLSHINLGPKGYKTPPKGTIQVTLFNPLGTVVKMFVVTYDLTDMPSNSQTFLRQRTLYMPVGESADQEDAQKWLRYLIHLRFASSKSGRIFLHTDIRMIIFRKSDMDTAMLHKQSQPYELRSFTRGPENPKFSPRK